MLLYFHFEQFVILETRGCQWRESLIELWDKYDNDTEGIGWLLVQSSSFFASFRVTEVLPWGSEEVEKNNSLVRLLSVKTTFLLAVDKIYMWNIVRTVKLTKTNSINQFLLMQLDFWTWKSCLLRGASSRLVEETLVLLVLTTSSQIDPRRHATTYRVERQKVGKETHVRVQHLS